MAKATDAQIKNAKQAMASGSTLPKGVRVNFGDPEPIQKAGSDDKPSVSRPGTKPTSDDKGK